MPAVRGAEATATATGKPNSRSLVGRTSASVGPPLAGVPDDNEEKGAGGGHGGGGALDAAASSMYNWHLECTLGEEDAQGVDGGEKGDGQRFSGKAEGVSKGSAGEHGGIG